MGHAHEHADSGYGAPPATYEEPAASYRAPAPTFEEPASGYDAPAPSYGYRRRSAKAEPEDEASDGAHGHEHADSGYGAPPATYEEPAASYGAPAPTYEEPASGYGAPAPSYGYEEEPLPDLTPIIVGILVLTGLSLLFPTVVSLATVRRKRHAEDEGDHQTDVIERVNEIYTAVVQSEECMEKIACEV